MDRNTEEAAKLLRHTRRDRVGKEISIRRVITALGIRLSAPKWHILWN